MTKFRVVLIALTAILTVMSPLFGSRLGSVRQSPAYAAASGPVSQFLIRADDNGNSSNDNNGNGNGNENGNANGNENGNQNGNGNGNGNENGNGNGNENANENEEGAVAVPAAPSAPAPSPVTSACASGGQQTVVATPDGRIAVTVFPSMPQSVQITINTAVDPNTLPPVPGTRIDNLLFSLSASNCGGGGAMAVLPAEVNLGMHYTDSEAMGFNESAFTIAVLDPVDNTWKPVAKQVPDPANNYVSATITDMGFYVVYQP